MRILIAVAGLAAGFVAAGSMAADVPDLTTLKSALGGQEPDTVRDAPVKGLYEVVIGPQLYYLSEDGRYVVNGSVIDLDQGADVTEPRRAEVRVDSVDAVGEENMVIFAPEGEVKHTVTVFTDIDCGYCRKLHNEIAQYNDAGIRVRYLFFPRSGPETESYFKAVSVWCADDRLDAMTLSKQGVAIDQRTCENPVTAHYELGRSIGVTGTPAILTESGQLIPGYLPADRLSEALTAG
jgi:thiol:disulfide interchange protein DsbC